MPLVILARHAHSTLNESQRINGDPSVEVGLTELGRLQALALGLELANVPLALAVHTRFGRTRQTLEIVLGGREPVETLVEPLFDDIDVGDLEGRTIADYRAWKREHLRSDPFPDGESLDDAARRYARAFRALAARREPTILVVCHEIPIRYALNAAAGSDELDGPVHDVANATPFLFDEAALIRAATGIESLTGA